MIAVSDEPQVAAPAIGFDKFVASRSSARWRSAYLLTGDRHKAEDLVQTAEALGVSIGTVKSQTARAMKALRASTLLAVFGPTSGDGA